MTIEKFNFILNFNKSLLLVLWSQSRTNKDMSDIIEIYSTSKYMNFSLVNELLLENNIATITRQIDNSSGASSSATILPYVNKNATWVILVSKSQKKSAIHIINNLDLIEEKTIPENKSYDTKSILLIIIISLLIIMSEILF